MPLYSRWHACNPPLLYMSPVPVAMSCDAKLATHTSLPSCLAYAFPHSFYLPYPADAYTAVYQVSRMPVL